MATPLPLAADMYLEAIPRQQRMILGAPGLAVVTYKPKTPVAEARRIYDLNCLASVWCCIENFLLALAEHQAIGQPPSAIPDKNRLTCRAGFTATGGEFHEAAELAEAMDN